MLTIKNATFKNFLSIGQITQAVRFDQGLLTLILAKNMDTGGSNGSGKTSMLQGLSYGLFGQPITNIKIDNLINSVNQKAMLVTIEFEKDGKEYRIERGRKPNLLRFYVNNKELDTETNDAQGENKQTQKEIERILGMSHTMFTHIIALNTSTVPFLKMKPADQKEVIEELLGIKQLSERADALKVLISKTKDSIKDEDSTIKANTEANSRIKTAIDKVKLSQNEWESVHAKKLQSLQQDIDEVSSIDFDYELSLFDNLESWIKEEAELRSSLTLLQKDIDILQKELSQINRRAQKKEQESVSNNDAQIKRLEQDLKRYEAESSTSVASTIARSKEEMKRAENDIASKRKEVLTFETDLAEIISQIENPDVHSCSSCGQALNGTDHLKAVIDKLKAKKVSVETSIKRNTASIASLEQQTKDIIQEIADIETDHTKKQKDALDKVVILKSEITSLKENAILKKEEIRLAVIEIRSEGDDIKIALEALTDDAHTLGDVIANLGKKPSTTFQSRDEVWKMRESRDMLVRDYETESLKENPYDSQIENLESTLVEINHDKMNELLLTQKHENFLLKLLSNKDSFVRKKIIEKTLLQLNKRLDYYLQALGLFHEVRFLPDLSVEITLLGRDFDFEQLSRGESNRVILAVSWSFCEIWESLNSSMNLLFCDELADTGMDSGGSEASYSILDKMARERNKNIFLISHKDALIGRANRVLMVTKKDQFTSIEEE